MTTVVGNRFSFEIIDMCGKESGPPSRQQFMPEESGQSYIWYFRMSHWQVGDQKCPLFNWSFQLVIWHSAKCPGASWCECSLSSRCAVQSLTFDVIGKATRRFWLEKTIEHRGYPLATSRIPLLHHKAPAYAIYRWIQVDSGRYLIIFQWVCWRILGMVMSIDLVEG